MIFPRPAKAGFGKQRLALKESTANLYWRAVVTHDLAGVAAKIAADTGARRVGIFGEAPAYAAFDVAVDVDSQKRWLPVPGDLLPAAPVLYKGPYDETVLIGLAEGVETVSGEGSNIREGIVIRPLAERYSEILGGRAIGKLVSQAYLTRKGGTEFE